MRKDNKMGRVELVAVDVELLLSAGRSHMEDPEGNAWPSVHLSRDSNDGSSAWKRSVGLQRDDSRPDRPRGERLLG